MVISDKAIFYSRVRMTMPGQPTLRGYFTYVILEPLNSISLPFRPMASKSTST